MTGVQFAALAQADDRLKLDKVAGYKGLISSRWRISSGLAKLGQSLFAFK